jgi:hypothetical protein
MYRCVAIILVTMYPQTTQINSDLQFFLSSSCYWPLHELFDSARDVWFVDMISWESLVQVVDLLHPNLNSSGCMSQEIDSRQDFSEPPKNFWWHLFWKPSGTNFQFIINLAALVSKIRWPQFLELEKLCLLIFLLWFFGNSFDIFF